MNRAALALVFGLVAAFVATAVPPPIWYVPLENVLALGDKPHGILIDYYGRVLVVVVAALIGAVVGRALPTSARVSKLALAWAALAAALSIALSATMLWNRPLHPITLPSAPSTSVKP